MVWGGTIVIGHNKKTYLIKVISYLSFLHATKFTFALFGKTSRNNFYFIILLYVFTVYCNLFRGDYEIKLRPIQDNSPSRTYTS